MHGLGGVCFSFERHARHQRLDKRLEWADGSCADGTARRGAADGDGWDGGWEGAVCGGMVGMTKRAGK